jgi:hypothetical protein
MDLGKYLWEIMNWIDPVSCRALFAAQSSNWLDRVSYCQCMELVSLNSRSALLAIACSVFLSVFTFTGLKWILM